MLEAQAANRRDREAGDTWHGRMLADSAPGQVRLGSATPSQSG
jgi:hypothetical protein